MKKQVVVLKHDKHSITYGNYNDLETGLGHMLTAWWRVYAHFNTNDFQVITIGVSDETADFVMALFKKHDISPHYIFSWNELNVPDLQRLADLKSELKGTKFILQPHLPSHLFLMEPGEAANRFRLIRECIDGILVNPFSAAAGISEFIGVPVLQQNSLVSKRGVELTLEYLKDKNLPPQEDWYYGGTFTSLDHKYTATYVSNELNVPIRFTIPGDLHDGFHSEHNEPIVTAFSELGATVDDGVWSGSHFDYLHRSRGLLHFTRDRSVGRDIVDAVVSKRLVLSSSTIYYSILYPDTKLKSDDFDQMKWMIKNQEKLIDKAYERIPLLYGEDHKNEFLSFIESL